MYYGSSGQEQRASVRVPNLFSFHYGDEVLVGRDISREGLGLFCPSKIGGVFHFHKSQQLRNCFIQIHGQTIRFTKLKVMHLELIGDDYVYGLCVESILPPELEKYLQVYEEKLEELENGESSSFKPIPKCRA